MRHARQTGRGRYRPAPGRLPCRRSKSAVAPRERKPEARRSPHAGAPSVVAEARRASVATAGAASGSAAARSGSRLATPKSRPCGTRRSEARWRRPPPQAGPQGGGRQPLLGGKVKIRHVDATTGGTSITPARPAARPSAEASPTRAATVPNAPMVATTGARTARGRHRRGAPLATGMRRHTQPLCSGRRHGQGSPRTKHWWGQRCARLQEGRGQGRRVVRLNAAQKVVASRVSTEDGGRGRGDESGDRGEREKRGRPLR